MKRNILLIALSLGMFSCKREDPTVPFHTIQFHSNINNPQYYDITINQYTDVDINGIYTIQGNGNVELKLYSAGGDTASVNSGDSLWVWGGIVVDGAGVKSFSGYHDAVLSYHIK